jgi:hypothetical protein
MSWVDAEALKAAWPASGASDADLQKIWGELLPKRGHAFRASNVVGDLAWGGAERGARFLQDCAGNHHSHTLSPLRHRPSPLPAITLRLC